MDATFYAMVADLAGAPQELINPHTGEVAGKATHTLFGRRKWDGETTPLLFAGQYEDTETGLVYNRYRYYNPYSGTYTSQDPLGVGPNPATAQGYVTNPTMWVDKQGLQAHPKLPAPSTMSPMEVAREGFHRQGLQSGDPYPRGFHEEWSRDGYDFEVRIHGPSADAPTNAPARNEDVLRIARREQGIDANGQGHGWYQGGADGEWYKNSFLKKGANRKRPALDPAADAAAIQVHIPTAGGVIP